MTILNGKKDKAVMNTGRYAEIIGNASSAVDITTGKKVTFGKEISLRPRQTMILEF